MRRAPSIIVSRVLKAGTKKEIAGCNFCKACNLFGRLHLHSTRSMTNMHINYNYEYCASDNADYYGLRLADACKSYLS